VRDANRYPARTYRLVNEIPTLLLIGIVILAVVKPF
jgi:putative membrane protein